MEDIFLYTFLGFLTALILTYFIIPKIILFSKDKRLYIKPNERAAHEKNTPFFGGIAIFGGVGFSFLFWGIGMENVNNIGFVLSSLIIIFIVGLIDDLLSLSPFGKMIGQLLAILVLVFFAGFEIDNMHGVFGIFNISTYISIPFTIFVVVVITNSYNLIDGIDGLAAGIGIIASIFFGIFAFLNANYLMVILAFSLTGSLIAYLIFNFYPAKILMGDTGSLVVGFIFAILSIDLIRSGVIFQDIVYVNKGPLIAISLLSVPLFDSLRVFLFRVYSGKYPLYADRNHIHHRLLDLGFSHRRIAIILYILSLVTIIFSLLLIHININYSIAIMAIIVYLLMLAPIYILRRFNKKNE